jgi:hypothetical protein
MTDLSSPFKQICTAYLLAAVEQKPSSGFERKTVVINFWKLYKLPLLLKYTTSSGQKL